MASGVSFKSSPKTVRVGKTGSFVFAFSATPGRSGKIGLASIKKVKVGTRKRVIAVASKPFKAAAASGAVKSTLKLSTASLRALKRLKQLKFKVTAVLDGKRFTTTLTLTAPKKS